MDSKTEGMRQSSRSDTDEKRTYSSNNSLDNTLENPAVLDGDKEVSNTSGLFDSVTSLKSVDDKAPTGPQDCKQKRENLEVIRKILEMFNMDETKRKYETQNVVEYVLDPNDFTIDCSLSTTRVRQRLSDLMGTDVIRLNDKRYFEKLTERLEDEYETHMDKKEEARAASEEQRLRRLMLEGVIDAPDDYRAVVFGNKPKQNKKKKRRKSKRQTQSRSTDDGRASDDEGLSKSRKDDIVTQVEIMNSSRPTSSKSNISGRSDSTTSAGKKKVSIQESENEAKGQTLNEMHARPPHHESALRSSSACSTHRKQRRVKSAAPRLSHYSKDTSSDDDDEAFRGRHYDTQSLPDKDYYKKGSRRSKYSLHEPERVYRLRNEETVAGLYSIAEELISPVKADDVPHKKVQVVKQKKMTVSYS